jgi:hypothetical protein
MSKGEINQSIRDSEDTAGRQIHYMQGCGLPEAAGELTELLFHQSSNGGVLSVFLLRYIVLLPLHQEVYIVYQVKKQANIIFRK